MIFDWKAEARGVVHSYAIGFMALDRSGEGPGSRVVGSGTLVEFHGIRGIATAANVAQAACTLSEVGLVRFTPGRSLEALTCRGDELEATYLRAERYGPDGPDLAFIRLPPGLENKIAATNAFFNSQVRWSAPAAEPGQPELYFITGLLAEASLDKGVVMGAAQTEHTTIIAVGAPRNLVSVAEQMDTMDFVRMVDPSAPPPTSYGGVSGGGVWRLREGPLGKTLIGIAYYELAADEEGHRVIRCHGPLGVHEALYLAVLDRYLPDKAAEHRATSA